MSLETGCFELIMWIADLFPVMLVLVVGFGALIWIRRKL